MVFFRASDAETPLSSLPSLTCSSESTIVNTVAPATHLHPSFVDNLSLSTLNQANPTNLTAIDNLNRPSRHPADVSGNNPFVFTCNQPFSSIASESLSNPTSQPFSNPQQFPSTSVDLEHKVSQLILTQPEETHSPPVTKCLVGSASVKSSKKQRKKLLELKHVVPLIRNDKTVGGVQANEADISATKKIAVSNEGIERRPLLNPRSNGQESRIQTRSQTVKQVKAAPPRFSLTLTKEEIEADFLVFTGSKPPKKPKKRAYSLQTQLDSKFPGLKLDGVSIEASKVLP